MFEDVLATFSKRSVAGRDVRTGSIRWQYTRRDRVLCDASSDGSVVMAIYAHDGLCDEISALDAGSGRRVWTRTLIGSATRAQLATSTIPGFLLVAMPDTVDLISPRTGLDLWVYQQKPGCATVSAVLGTGVAATIGGNAVQGQVLMTTRCSHASSLSLLAGYVPPVVSSGPQIWTSAGGQSPLALDGAVDVLAADGRKVDVLDPQTGNPMSQIALSSPLRPALRPRAFVVPGRNIEVAATDTGQIGFTSTRLLWYARGT